MNFGKTAKSARGWTSGTGFRLPTSTVSFERWVKRAPSLPAANHSRRTTTANPATIAVQMRKPTTTFLSVFIITNVRIELGAVEERLGCGRNRMQVTKPKQTYNEI